jgi:hypothetical protein
MWNFKRESKTWIPCDVSEIPKGYVTFTSGTAYLTWRCGILSRKYGLACYKFVQGDNLAYAVVPGVLNEGILDTNDWENQKNDACSGAPNLMVRKTVLTHVKSCKTTKRAAKRCGLSEAELELVNYYLRKIRAPQTDTTPNLHCK